jgi:hypothetical protein
MNFPLIIKSMAIIRCPYCHAIIDENDKYCNNCGTQLLFPEDESVEEEIPGEKIVDVEEDEEEEKDYSLDEPGEKTGEGIEEAEEERTGELVSGTGAPDETKDIAALLEGEDAEGDQAAVGEDEPEEVIIVEEIAAGESAAKKDVPVTTETFEAEPEKPEACAVEEDTRAYPAPAVGKEEAEDETVELVIPAAAQKKDEAVAAGPGTAAAKEAEPGPEKARTGEIEGGVAGEAGLVPVTFDTQELEGIGKTVELSRDRLDKILQVMAEKQEETAGGKAPEPVPEEKTGTLPPWADRIKGASPVVTRDDTRETGGKVGEAEEEEIFPRRKPSDSGIGLPERITQADLPFGQAGETAGEEDAGEEAGEEEAVGPVARSSRADLPKREETRPLVREEARPEAGFDKGFEPEEEAPHPPFNFSLFLKAKAFDVLFIGVFWLVALWVAARSMGATLFEILSVVSSSALMLYAAFILLYFFLFKFFLGETLGDRLFKERE